MRIQLPSETIFFSIERAIKEYRKYSLKNITSQISDLTLDQGLILLFLNNRPEMSQKELADLIFRDDASVTRMINSLVGKKYLSRSLHDQDRRKFDLEITSKGKAVLNKLSLIIGNNRENALDGVSQVEIKQLRTILNKIISNCESVNTQ